MPFIFTTAMTSEFPGVGFGPGVSDFVGRSVASPFLEPDTIPRVDGGPATRDSVDDGVVVAGGGSSVTRDDA